MKNAHARPIRNRTFRPDRPEASDRRVRRTRASLHEALLGLAREKPYPAIAVKEILDRANVGRSTFYTHFRDKDDLLESGIHEILQSTQRQPRRGGPLERVLAFSLPLLAHIDEHRRAPGPQMTREGRIVMHQRMQHALTALIADELGQSLPRRPHAEMPTSLLAQHVASTFVLVLDWWIESDTPLTPAEVDSRFRALVVPALAAL